MVNLKTNYPSVNKEKEVFEAFLAYYLPQHTLRYPPAEITIEAYASQLQTMMGVPSGILVSHSTVVSCSNATAAIYLLLLYLQQKKATIGVEDFTYSGFKTAARQVGCALVSIACDHEGMLPGAVEEAVRKGIDVFYLQPTIHNPTCRVMSEQRRNDIAAAIGNSRSWLIEDDAYRFLHPQPPRSFLELMPGKTVHLFSLSKPYNPFIQMCYLVYPNHTMADLMQMVQNAGATPSYLMQQFAAYLSEDGLLPSIIAEKQQQAIQRQAMIKPLLNGLPYDTFPTSFHIWMKLPPPHRSGAVVSALREQKILVNGSHEYALDNNESCIRIALSAEPDAYVLQQAITQIRHRLADY